MHITIAAYGTRGDVQPVLALALGLERAGHRVRILAGRNFESWVRGYGFDFAATVDMEAVMRSDAGVRWSQSGDNQWVQFRMMRRLLDSHADELITPFLSLPADSDLLLSGFTAEPFVQAASEASGIPYANAFLQPYTPTRSGAALMQAVLPGRTSLINLIAGRLVPRLVWSLSSRPANNLRAALGLRPHSASSYIRATRDTPVVYGFSQHVVPRPDDWGAEKVVSGYWFLDERADWQPSPELTTFIEQGNPPIYIGFGSMISLDVDATARLITKAVTASGERAVVGRGWGGIEHGRVSERIFVVDHAPHDWLFERVLAVIHHGGAGTTAAGLRAGRPTMIIPHMADQPYWARRVYELGVGVAPVWRNKLTSDDLSAGIERLVCDASLRQKASALGERIRAEDGVAAAVRPIGNLVGPS